MDCEIFYASEVCNLFDDISYLRNVGHRLWFKRLFKNSLSMESLHIL